MFESWYICPIPGLTFTMTEINVFHSQFCIILIKNLLNSIRYTSEISYHQVITIHNKIEWDSIGDWFKSDVILKVPLKSNTIIYYWIIFVFVNFHMKPINTRKIVIIDIKLFNEIINIFCNYFAKMFTLRLYELFLKIYWYKKNV